VLALGDASRPPMIIPAPNPAKVRSAAKMTVFAFMRSLARANPSP
jgi:hypothetical protein